MSTLNIRGISPSIDDDSWVMGLAFAAVVITTVFSSSTVAPTIVGNVLALVTFAGFVVLAVARGSTQVRIRKSQAMLLLILLFVLVVHLVRAPSGASLTNSPLVRGPLLFTLAILYLYYVPEVVREFRAMSVLAIVAAATIIIGLPSLVIGPYRIGSAAFVPYTDFALPFVSGRMPALTSFYSDSNAVSKLAMYGSFASLYLLTKEDNLVYRSLFVVSVLGLYLGHSRGAILSFVVGVGIVGIYLSTGRRFGQMATFSVVVGSILGFGMLAGLLPRPTVVAQIPLSSRGEAWRATIEMIARRPIFGHGLADPGELIAPALGGQLRGLAPQNAYLYVTLATGVVGGAAYLLFLVRTLLSAPLAMAPSDAVLVGFCTGLFILGFFETIPLFGLNQSAFIASLAFGYLLKSGKP